MANVLIIYHSNFRYISGHPRDNSDYEWELYRYAISKVIVAMFLTSCLHSQIKRLSIPAQRYSTILLWIAVNIWLTSFKCIGIFLAFSTVMIGATLLFRCELIAWVCCIISVLKTTQYIQLSVDFTVFYREYNFYLYGIIKVLNYCIHLSRNPQKPFTKDALERCLQYLFYPPYSFVLIVLYDDFEQQITKVENGNSPPISLRKMAFRCIRLVFWFYVYELISHFIYAAYFFEDTFALLAKYHIYEIVSIAYVRGQLFHLKYVVIFGVNAWFASLDGMKPPGKPICISRVSRYSAMWKMFDRGLYQFLKNQVYVPLGGNKDSKYFWLRRFFAMVGAFVFVLAWHGPILPYVYWVTLSGIELCIESLGKAINRTEIWWRISDKIGLRNQRRLVSFAMVTTVTPGIYGVFFFLGQKGTGKILFTETFMKAMKDAVNFNFTIFPKISAGVVLIHLLILNYAFSNVCLELDETLKPKVEEKPKVE